MDKIASGSGAIEPIKLVDPQSLAERPTEYHVSVIPTAPFLVVPEVSSERRDYIPIAGWSRR